MKPIRVAMLLVVAAAGLALALFSGKSRDEPKFRIVEPGSEEAAALTGAADRGAEMSAQSRSLAADQVDYLAQLGPAAGRTFWVAPGGDTGTGSGTRDDPWRGLADHLGEVRGGDRLVLLPGRYTGPFVLPRFQGDDPVELVGKASPVFRNEDDAQAPVVRVEGRWQLVGLEIQPGLSSIGVELASQDPVQLRALHINSGGREGIMIRRSARGATIVETHVHHVGDGDRAGIHIEDGVRDLQLLRNKVHNTGGPAILLFEPGRFQREARGRQGARRLNLPDQGIAIVEDVWEP